MFERESRREKILEAKMREFRLKCKVKPQDFTTFPGQQNEMGEKLDECQIAEREFFAAIEKVFPVIQFSHFPYLYLFNLKFIYLFIRKKQK